jgi:uncharacterized protein DUF6263
MEGPTMLSFRFRFAILLTALLFSLPGCSYFQAESDPDDEFAEFDEDEKGDKEADEKLAAAQKAAESELALRLKVGDRFPLKKKIAQQLTQTDAQGSTLINRSILEMMLSLEVEEIRDGSKRLAVRYHRVHYGHNIAGRQVEYSSDQTGPVATEALAYVGLKDNGFSFWIGPDNRVVELIGFSEFLQRCLQNVPPAYRDQVMRQLETTQNDDGLANFVDDGIGLLPYSNDPHHPGVAVKVGSTWELKPKRSEGPISTNIVTKCVLKNLTETSAEIGLLGRIYGTTAPAAVQEGGRYMHVQVKGGTCFGTCMIDRHSGLPTQSEVNRSIEMLVQLPDNSEITQRKEVQTTITSFLDQGNRAVGMQNEPGQLSPPSSLGQGGSSFGQGGNSSQVTQAAGIGSTSSNLDDRNSDSRPRSSGTSYFEPSRRR